VLVLALVAAGIAFALSISAERWPVVKALDQFGTLSHVASVERVCRSGGGGPLHFTGPGPCTIPTFDFSHVRYSSPYLAFVSKDLLREDNGKIRVFQRLSPDGSLLVAGRTRLEAVSPVGKRLWSVRVGRTIGSYSRPSLAVDAAGTSYVGASDGKLRIISANGRLVSTLSVGPASTQEVASVVTSVLGPGGRLIVNGTDGVLRVYGP